MMQRGGYGPGANPLSGPVSGVTGFTAASKRWPTGFTGKGKRVHAWFFAKNHWHRWCTPADQEITPTDQAVTCRVCLQIIGGER